MSKQNSTSGSILAMIIACSVFIGCSNSKDTSEQAKTAFNSVIPKPKSATATGKTFFLTNSTVVQTAGHDNAKPVAAYLSDVLSKTIGVTLKSDNNEATENLIRLSLGEADYGTEGYKLAIDEKQITISASHPAGLFYGVQTLRQLIADKNDGDSKDAFEIATGSIEDRPEYEWRGSMLDVARHFFSVEDVKRYIDLISYYKMNRLHLHLSDDQGWRIEIKSWPNLTAIGGLSQVGGGKGGFYTQDQYKDIVDYASKQFVTIVPEIDLPGHINAALASYPELNAGPVIELEKGKDKPVAGKPYTGIEVGFSTLHIKKDITFKFVNDVIREISEITPGPYFHVGGDEAAVTKKPDYIAFINRFKEIVKANNKKMIGWEEIAQADLDSTIISQHWHSEKYAKEAVDKGAKLIFSPSKKVYMDMQYDSTSRLGLHWAAYIEVDSSYMWDPATRVPGIDREDIVGVEAPLWSETIATMDDIEYLLFPRLPGVAEIGWTASKDRNWDEYKVRLANQAKKWKAMGIDYYKSPKVEWVE
ncbi:MAG TPA: beta-N-acetylhexosaminidase [Chryseosolibacter sp.]